MVQIATFDAEIPTGGFRIKEGKLVPPGSCRVKTKRLWPGRLALFEIFAKAYRLEEILDLANQYGMLTQRFGGAEPIGIWQTELDDLAQMCQQFHVHSAAYFTDDDQRETAHLSLPDSDLLRHKLQTWVTVSIGRKRGKPVIQHQPKGLLGLLWAQFAWVATEQIRLAVCGGCQRPIIATKSNVKHCSPTCRNKAYLSRKDPRMSLLDPAPADQPQQGAT